MKTRPNNEQSRFFVTNNTAGDGIRQFVTSVEDYPVNPKYFDGNVLLLYPLG